MKHYGVPDLIRQLYMHSLNSLASTYFIFIEPHVSSTDTKLQVATFDLFIEMIYDLKISVDLSYLFDHWCYIHP